MTTTKPQGEEFGLSLQRTGDEITRAYCDRRMPLQVWFLAPWRASPRPMPPQPLPLRIFSPQQLLRLERLRLQLLRDAPGAALRPHRDPLVLAEPLQGLHLDSRGWKGR